MSTPVVSSRADLENQRLLDLQAAIAGEGARARRSRPRMSFGHLIHESTFAERGRIGVAIVVGVLTSVAATMIRSSSRVSPGNSREAGTPPITPSIHQRVDDLGARFRRRAW